MLKSPDLRSKSRTKSRTTAKARHCTHEEAIVDGIARHVARPAFVMHEIQSHIVHVDVHVVPPAAGRDFWFLFTTGMSALPMTKPPCAPGSRRAEVSILLPPYWRMDRGSLRDARWFWPIRELKGAAMLPHRNHTWLGGGHTLLSAGASGIRSLDPSTRLSSVVAVPSALLPAAIVTPVGPIDVLTLVPLYPEELDFKLEHGFDALADALATAGVSDVIDPARASAVPIGA